MFNADPRFSGHIMGLPLGYFISRIEASRKALTGAESTANYRGYKSYLDDVLEMTNGCQSLSECVLEAVVEDAGFSEQTEFKIKKSGDLQSVPALKVNAGVPEPLSGLA